MARERILKVSILSDARGVQRTFGEVERSASRLGKLGSRLGGLFAVGAAGAAAAGIGALAVGLKDMYAEAREAQKVGRQTDAVIRSTGRAAGLTAAQFSDLAESISDSVAVDDEVIQSGENILATFTNIKNAGPNRIFDQATMAAVDMAAALNHGEVTTENLQKANLQLGKALNDPIKGITALRKVGVSFTDSQRDQIKTLVESGRTMDAQRIILRELGKEFGGSAKAAVTPMERLSVIIGNLKERIGTALLPIIDRLATWLSDRLPKALGWLQLNLPAILARTQVAFGWARDGAARLGAAVQAVSSWFTGTFLPAARSARDWMAKQLKPSFDQVRKSVADNRPQLAALGSALLLIGKWIATRVIPVFVAMQVFMQTQYAKAILATISLLVRLIGWYVRSAQAVGQMVATISAHLEKLRKALTGAGTWLVNVGRDIIGGLLSGMKAVLPDIPALLTRVKDAIVDGLKRLFDVNSPSRVMAGLGRNIMGGLITGMLAKSGALAKTVKSIGGGLLGLFGQFTGGSGSRGGVVKLGQQMAAARGWVGSQWEALYSLWQGESGWNPNAQNPTSTAYGIPQFLDSTWATVGARKTSDPAGQIAAGLTYIAQRYGNPMRAWAAWQGRSPHWYAEGGIFTRPSIIGVGEAGPEAVIPLGRMGAGMSVSVDLRGATFLGGSREVAERLAPELASAIRAEQRRRGVAPAAQLA